MQNPLSLKKPLETTTYNMNGEEVVVTHGSGNVFADLGFDDADEIEYKAGIAFLIKQAIHARNLTQKRAGELLGLEQPKVSDIIRGRLDGFSGDRLMRYLTQLGCDVTITVSPPHPETQGQVVFT
jgi:predicted XRE-type DNA-binding protein